MIDNEKEKNMLCPSCGEQAISFLRFTFIDPRKTKCSHCQAELRANDKLKNMFWKSTAYIFTMLAITFSLIVIFKLGDLGIIVLFVLLFLGLWYEYKEWKEGGYELAETDEKSKS
jgi:hypothetical protein